MSTVGIALASAKNRGDSMLVKARFFAAAVLARDLPRATQAERRVRGLSPKGIRQKAKGIAKEKGGRDLPKGRSALQC